MQFVACSGSVLSNLVRQDSQIAKVTGPMDALILTVGGNDVGFFKIADACLFHIEPTRDYGPAFPDENGECRKAIDFAAGYIENTFANDVRATYQDLLATDIVKSNPNLKIYHTGYGHFFSTDGEGDADWCTAQQVSFNIPVPPPLPGQPPLPAANSRSFLTKELRERINDLVQRVNDVIKGVTEEPAFQGKFSFIDISPVFTGHRFCEVGSNKPAQYYGKDVWLWNVVAPVVGAIADNVGLPPLDFFTDPDFNFGNPVEVFQQTINDRDSILGGDPRTGNKVISGWRIRPFHPKGSAYLAIKDVIVARLKADGIPGA